jgi:hypothetical protein
MPTALFVAAAVLDALLALFLERFLVQEYRFTSLGLARVTALSLTWSLLALICRLGVLPRASHIPTRDRWRLGALGFGAVLSIDASVIHNSSVSSEIWSLLIIPVMIAYRYFVERQTTPLPLLCAIAGIFAGIRLFAPDESEPINFFPGGLSLAVVVIVVPLFHNYIGRAFDDFSVSPLALLHSVAGPQLLLLLLATLAIEFCKNPPFWRIAYDSTWLGFIAALVTVRVAETFLAFALIGRIGALSYAVVTRTRQVPICLGSLLLAFFGGPAWPLVFSVKVLGLAVSTFSLAAYGCLAAGGADQNHLLTDLADVAFEDCIV